MAFSLDHAAKNGWGPWMGAAKAGITGFDGISGKSPNAAGSVAPGAATGATSTGSAPAGTTLTTPTGAVAPYTLGVQPPAPTAAPAIVINQSSPFKDPIADANPWSDLGGAMASAVDPNKPQFLSGGTDDGATPPPPEFESVLPATGAAPDITPITPDAGDISPLGGAFRIAENIGKAGVPKTDRFGRPLEPGVPVRIKRRPAARSGGPTHRVWAGGRLIGGGVRASAPARGI